jgi:3-oxoacyl-[acyl-carrier protein] reductase
MNLDLTGRNALVCGASRGIGQATAVALSNLGANLTLVARDPERLAQTLGNLSTRDGQAHHSISADVHDSESWASALADLLDNRGVFHILVNNSGGPPAGPLHLADPEAFVAPFRQHLVANHIAVQQLLPGMRDAQYGRVINIISTSVKEPIKGLGVSNTIRGAVASWAKTLAGELAADGITVNNVLPGFTDTERLDYIFTNKAEKTGKSKDDVIAEALAQIPAGRFAEPSEIANAIAFLASPAAAYINGVSLAVDGGRLNCL